MPRTDDDIRRSTTRLFVIGWLLWTFGIGAGILTQGDVVLQGFTIYQLTSFVVLYAFGRMHDLEVDKYLPWLDHDDDSGGRQYIDRTRPGRHDAGTGGFVFRDDREKDDDQ